MLDTSCAIEMMGQGDYPAMRKSKNDVISLDRTGLAALAVFMSLILVYVIWKVVPSREQQEPDIPVNVHRELEKDVVAYEVLGEREVNPGTADEREMDIVLPCAVERKQLVAAVKDALLKMYVAHQGNRCHKVSAYLEGLRPPGCPAVAEGYLCKAGRVIDGVRFPPWDIRTSLVARTERPEMTDAALGDLCRELEKAGVCPWADQLVESEAIGKLQSRLAVDPEEAKDIFEKGRRLTSASYTYRQDLR